MAGFHPERTYSITVTTTATAPLQVFGGRSYLLTNVGANVVHVALTAGATNAVAATAGGQASFPILPNASLLVESSEASFVSAIAAAAGNTLFVTTGIGEDR